MLRCFAAVSKGSHCLVVCGTFCLQCKVVQYEVVEVSHQDDSANYLDINVSHQWTNRPVCYSLVNHNVIKRYCS